MSAQPKSRHFPIAISPLWRLFLLPAGVTADQAFAEIDDGDLHVRFGRFFDYHFPLEDVEDAVISQWPLWAGIGPRADFRGAVGLVGTYVNVVEVRFTEPRRIRLVLPVPCRRLFVSMEEPHAFIAALKKKTAPEAKAA